MPAKILAIFTTGLGLACLAGWLLDVQSLTSIVPGAVEMKFNTALCFVSAGAALFMLARGADRHRPIALGLAVLVLLIGAATLCEYALGWDLGIDQLLVADRDGAYSVFRGRMSPYSTVGFIGIGAALLLLPYPRLTTFAKGFASIAALIGMVSLLGYLWNATDLITDSVIPPVAINSGIAFTLVGLGLWLTPSTRRLDPKLGLDLTAIELRILLGFLVALSLVLAAGSYTYRSNEQFANSVIWIAQTQKLRADLAGLTSALSSADLALRDYVSTGESGRLAEYRHLVGVAQQHLNSMANLAAPDPPQQAQLRALHQLFDARIGALAGILRAYDDYGRDAARAMIAVTRHTGDMPAIRAITQNMDDGQAKLLSDSEALAKHGRRTTLLSLLITLSLTVVLFAALFRGVHGEMIARRKAETALRASDQYNRSILDSSPDSLSIISPGGRLLSMTPQACRMMGITDFASVAGSDWLSLWPAAAAEAGAAVAAARDGATGRFRGFCATHDGVAKWWDVIVAPIPDAGDGQPQLLVTARDISDVVRGEEELREAHQFLDTMLEHLPAIIIVRDAVTRRIVRLNHEAARFIGKSVDEVIGSDMDQYLETRSAQIGRERDALMMEQGTLMIFPEETFIGSEGARTLRSMRMPIFNAQGAPQYIVAMSVDITEQKLREQAISELNLALMAKADQLQTTVEKLAATNSELESFSYSISHDLRAPLRAIDGFALMLDEDYAERFDDEGRRYLKVIRDNSKRMGALIDDLLAFSQLGRLPVASHEINVEALVREVVDEQLVSCEQPAPQIDVAPLPPAFGDRTLLRQVWTNLISNAIKYSSKSAAPRVAVEGQVNGKEILYSVRDNGVGFDMEYYDKLFGVFQRLHRNDEFAGTGVGLAIVHRVVTRHGGRVWAEGKINGGATFSFALPKETVHG